jgi:hypothetical protein
VKKQKKYEVEGITVDEVLENVLRILCRIYSFQKIDLLKTVSTVIATDTVGGKTWHGFMAYKRILLIKFENDVWAIGRGETWGDYPADAFIGDIFGIRVSSPKTKSDKVISKEIKKIIQDGPNFKNSIMIARQNGEIIVSENPDNPFSEVIAELIQSMSRSYVAQEFIVEKRSGHPSDMNRIVIHPMRYRRQFAPILAKIISVAVARLQNK